VMGMPPGPAIIDEAFVAAVVRWQATHELDQDGKVGPVTTRSFVDELGAEGQRALARQLRLDNYVNSITVSGPTYTDCSSPQPRFRWDVRFRTSLRDGWIIQRIDNTWNGTHCGGGAMGVGTTARYWEAWQVDRNGTVTPTGGSGENDQWIRRFPGGTRGTWSMTGRLYTVLSLPAAAGFGAGNVPDAGILQSTTTAPSSDRLGLVEGFRRIGGRWDCCDPDPANWFHRRI
jgi:hypothetical protein